MCIDAPEAKGADGGPARGAVLRRGPIAALGKNFKRDVGLRGGELREIGRREMLAARELTKDLGESGGAGSRQQMPDVAFDRTDHSSSSDVEPIAECGQAGELDAVAHRRAGRVAF